MSLGKLINFSDYFNQASASDSGCFATADEYVSPCLQQAVGADQRNPISRWCNYWRASTALMSANSMLTLALATSNSDQPVVQQLWREVQQQRQRLRRAASVLISAEQVQIAERLYQQAHAAIIHAVCGTVEGVARNPAVAMFNPRSTTGRAHISGVRISNAASNRLYAADESSDRVDAVIDIPNCGFTVLPLADESEPAVQRQPAGSNDQPSLLAVEEEQHLVLRTEFFESRIDKRTGSLAALYGYTTRGNRCSQRIVWRSPDFESVEMVADDVRIECATAVMAKIRSRSRLLNDEGETLARVEQLFTTFRGSRRLEVELALADVRDVAGTPWTNYVGLRTAWPNELCDLYRCANEIRTRTERQRFESPLFVEFVDGERRTALMTDGLPYHQRVGDRALDTLLVVANESTRQFRFALGVDVPHALVHAAERLVKPQPVACSLPNANDGNSGWLCHVDSKRVVAEDWRPLGLDALGESVELDRADGSTDAALATERAGEGVVFSLTEMAGRDVVVTIRLFRHVSQAGKIGVDCSSDGECKVSDGAIRVTLAAHEWTQVEARW